tara:strand:+ start:425 stop:718 length:294 start_codon:yes stop_codon:yes gene_type:complete
MEKIIFFRQGVEYTIQKSEVIRVMQSSEIDNLNDTDFAVMVIDGQPTVLLEPAKLFGRETIKQSLWKYPNFIFIMRRDGDVGRGIFVDNLKWGIFRE